MLVRNKAVKKRRRGSGSEGSNASETVKGSSASTDTKVSVTDPARQAKSSVAASSPGQAGKKANTGRQTMRPILQALQKLAVDDASFLEEAQSDPIDAVGATLLSHGAKLCKKGKSLWDKYEAKLEQTTADAIVTSGEVWQTALQTR